MTPRAGTGRVWVSKAATRLLISEIWVCLPLCRCSAWSPAPLSPACAPYWPRRVMLSRVFPSLQCASTSGPSSSRQFCSSKLLLPHHFSLPLSLPLFSPPPPCVMQQALPTSTALGARFSRHRRRRGHPAPRPPPQAVHQRAAQVRGGAARARAAHACIAEACFGRFIRCGGTTAAVSGATTSSARCSSWRR